MQCGKDVFPSWHKARSVARRQMDKARRTTGKRVQRIEPYLCERCGGLHLTGYNFPNLKRVA